MIDNANELVNVISRFYLSFTFSTAKNVSCGISTRPA
jgi:hypothetical protein